MLMRLETEQYTLQKYIIWQTQMSTINTPIKLRSIRMVDHNNSFFCLCFQEEDDVTLILNVKTCVFNLKCALCTGKCSDMDIQHMDTNLV